VNIIKALKSGRRFKRKDWTLFHSDPISCCTARDILADDWEVEQKPITETLSEAEFEAAFHSAWNRSGLIYGSALILFHKELKKELGL